MYYLDVCLELQDSSDIELSPVNLKKNILEAVRQFLGEEGAKSTIDILKYRQFDGKPCVYNVHRASPNLLSFISDSRVCEH